MGRSVIQLDDQLYVELWVSLASLLRSYTAAHGLNGNRQATVELGQQRITVRHSAAWLELERDGARVRWRREDGSAGLMELTESGRLRWLNPRSQNRDLGHPDSEGEREEEMDMVAEAWARELMR
jgi:hypothetical protein